MAKETTYKRLKRERVELLNDIRVMVMSPNSAQALELKIKYEFTFTSEDMMFYGHSRTDTQGIMNYITKANK